MATLANVPSSLSLTGKLVILLINDFLGGPTKIGHPKSLNSFNLFNICNEVFQWCLSVRHTYSWRSVIGGHGRHYEIRLLGIFLFWESAEIAVYSRCYSMFLP